MPIKYHSNRQLHARNTRVVPIAQSRLDQVADLAQEQYVNALSVNGYDALVYSRLTNGRRCTCSHVLELKAGQILDEKGNATESHIQSLLTGADFSIEDYATMRNPNPNATVQGIRVIQPEDYVTGKTPFKPHRENLELDDPFVTEVTTLQSMEDAFAEVNLGAVSAQKCSICYGSGFVGGYSLHNGNRFVLDVTYDKVTYSGYSVAQEVYPNLFTQQDEQGYIQFDITLPVGILSVDRVQLWNNSLPVKGATLRIGTNLTNLITLTEDTVLTYATGLPCIIVVSDADSFSHLELQFNMSSVHTYIEYPRLTKTGDLSVLDAIDSVQLVVSPQVMNVQAWDIIVDNVFKKSWRVTSSNWFNDRKMNIHGWDVSARLVQPYEVFTNIAGRFNNSTRYVSTRLPRK